MSLFKHRPNKLKYLSNVQTLDECHKKWMNSYEEKKSSIPYKKERLIFLTQELIHLEKNIKNFSTDDIRRRSSIKSEIKFLQDDISRIEGNIDIKEYFSKAGDILLSYYDEIAGNFYNVETGDECLKEQKDSFDSNKLVDLPSNQSEKDIYSEHQNTTETENMTECKTDHRDINEDSLRVNLPIEEQLYDITVNTESPDKMSNALLRLNIISQSKRKIKKPVKKRKKLPDPVNASKSILNFFASDIINTTDIIENKIVLSRATLQDKYLMLVDRNYACDHIKKNRIKYCTQCNIEKHLNQSEGLYVCQKCGEVEHIIIESEIPSHKDAINEKPKYPYKKLNHLKEKLNQLQAKETADISDNVFETLKKELKKQRIKTESSTPPMIKKYLKKHKFVECYEHLQQIYCKISGASPVTLSRDVEEKVINMFNEMQDAYQEHRPTNRSNFLNYSYVLNKIFRILKMDVHAKYFGLLKSKDKLREQDVIWSKICRDMKWKYFPSI